MILHTFDTQPAARAAFREAQAIASEFREVAMSAKIGKDWHFYSVVRNLADAHRHAGHLIKEVRQHGHMTPDAATYLQAMIRWV